jgi:protein required for attachment to host cells
MMPKVLPAISFRRSPSLVLRRTRGYIIGLHVTQECEREQHDEFGHGLVRIPRAVAHGDAMLAAVVEVDMVEADEGHRDGAQLRAVFQYSAAQRKVRHDQNLGVLDALDELVVIAWPRVVGAHRDVLRQRAQLGLQRGVRHS